MSNRKPYYTSRFTILVRSIDPRINQYINRKPRTTQSKRKTSQTKSTQRRSKTRPSQTQRRSKTRSNQTKPKNSQTKPKNSQTKPKTIQTITSTSQTNPRVSISEATTETMDAKPSRFTVVTTRYNKEPSEKKSSSSMSPKVKALAEKLKRKTQRSNTLSKLPAMRREAVKSRNQMRKNKSLLNSKKFESGSNYYRISGINKVIEDIKHPDLKKEERVDQIEINYYGTKKPGTLMERIDALEFDRFMETKTQYDIMTRISDLEISINPPRNILNKTFKNFVNPSLKPTFQIISRPKDSGSKSLVYFVRINTGIQFVLKITYVPSGYVNTNHSALAEYKFYTIMKRLILHNITPHVFRSVAKLDTFETKKLGNINYHIKNLFERKNVFVMLTETNMNPRSNIYNFYKIFSFIHRANKSTIKKILYNLFFEIMYTLVAFKKLKFKHNDLHMANIMIIFNKKNMFHNTLDDVIKNLRREYEYEHDDKKINVLLPNTGVSARIFDFDRSCLISKKGEIRADNLYRFKNFYQDCNDNFYRDTYKFICGFYDYIQNEKKFVSKEISEAYDPITNFIESCFYQQSLLLEGKVTDKDGNDIIIDKSFTQIGVRRYYYVSQPIDEYMKSPEEILFELSQMFPHKINDRFAPGSEKPKTVPFQKFSLLKMKEHDIIPRNIFKK